jgi:pumilio family protein 6
MHTAISKATMNGTKRKGPPVKDTHVKQNKKPKTESGVKSAMKKEKVKPTPVMIRKIEKSSDSDSEGSTSDGGVPLQTDPTEDSESEEIPTAADGVHPERAKAVALNSKSSNAHLPSLHC